MAVIEADLDLLQRYIEGDDVEAFSQIVQRHSSLVYYTCLRVLGDRERAEDAAQETFQRLMRKPEKISYSLSAWLHRVATRHSIDVLRSDNARRRRERTYQAGLERRRKPAEPWAEVSAQVDEAMAKLNEEPRALLVEHFLRGRTQAEIARELGVSKATLCRRVDAALAQLRKRMGGTTALGVGILVGAWVEHASAAVPETLAAELGKMAMVSGTTYGLASAALGATLKTWPVVVLGGTISAAAVAMIVLAAWGLTRPSPAERTASTEVAVHNEIVEREPESPFDDSQELVILRERSKTLSAKQVVAFSMQGDRVSIVFGDTHVATVPIDEARKIIEPQAGATLEQIAAIAP